MLIETENRNQKIENRKIANRKYSNCNMNQNRKLKNRKSKVKSECNTRKYQNANGEDIENSVIEFVEKSSSKFENVKIETNIEITPSVALVG